MIRSDLVNGMKSSLKAGLGAALIGVLTGIFGSASAQLPIGAGDYPMYKGTSSRIGRNLSPVTNGPGRTNLRWYTPNATDGRVSRIIRNNTYDDGSANVIEGTFTGADEASDFFTVPATGTVAVDDLQGSTATPGYAYSSIISAKRGAPLLADSPVDARSIFEYRISPKASQNVAGNYGLYVWIPQGPTTIKGVKRYSARYYVYEVLYGNGQSYVDILDTYAGGRGWVRLGNGGSPTNALFPYNGLLPLRVRLYNTNPRDESIVPPPGSPDADLMNDPNAIVYADGALAVPDYGSYTASPIISRVQQTIGSELRVVTAANRPAIRGTQPNGLPNVQSQGVVSSHLGTSGQLRWSWSPTDVALATRTLDNTSAGVANGGFAVSTLSGRYQGANYLEAPAVTVGPAFSTVGYTPTLATGEYEVYVYVGGNNNSQTFARAQRWEIRQGATVETVEVDMSGTARWVKIGTQSTYRHSAESGGDPLTVVATSFSGNVADAGRKAYADAVRFVGDNNLAVTSTPMQVSSLVTPVGGGTPISRSVVVVAAEDGRIYCLDSQGRANGTTVVYWAYPSLPDKDNASWTDPNHVAGQDGVGGVAEMPTGFDTSSAFIERINGEDFLYIAGSNGRIYCISMAGRGDFDLNTGKVGTTQRRWSYPSDYPSATVASNLGRFKGSLGLYRSGSTVSVIAPTAQGRIYSLDALGNDTTKTTTVNWAYPALTQPTLGAIHQTPAIAYDRIFFGTLRKNDNPGQFFALNAGTGAVVWSKTNLPDATASDYLGGPTTADGSMMGAAVNVVFTPNQNGRVYAWNAADGTAYWPSSENLGVGVESPLTFTQIRAYNTSGTLTSYPVVMAQTSDGRITALFANAAVLNVALGRRAWGFQREGVSTEAGIATGFGWMFALDSAGYLYAFNDTPGLITPDPDGDDPGEAEVVENDPIGNLYKYLKVGSISKEAYLQLRDNPTTLTRTQAMATLATTNLAYEWGETVYLLAYDFKYEASQVPVVNFTVGSDGVATRQNPVEAREFAGTPEIIPGSTPPVEGTGYAIYAFTIQGGGSSALPPGEGTVSAQVTATFATNDRRTVATLSKPVAFSVANPLAIFMAPSGTSPNFVVPSGSNVAIGYSILPGNDQNRVNGSPDITTTSHNENNLATSVGQVANGQTGVTQIFVTDRSLLTLIRGPGRGLDGVRMERKDLVWQGGSTAIVNPLNALLFPNFEDLPVRFPNDSLDYPDVRRDQVRVIRDLTGSTENPTLRSVALNPPLDSGGGDLDDETEGANRRLTNTPFDFEIDFPRYQPANGSLIPDSRGVNLPGGYAGRLSVFVDSNQNGALDATGNRREAYRSFTLGGQVVPDVRLSVGTPTLDLGSLAAGTGYDPLLPSASGSGYSPWNVGKTGSNPVWGGLFGSLSVLNDGNVNLTNVRLAKGTNVGTNYLPWPIFSTANDDLGWLDASVDVWSDFDANNKFNLGYPAIIQKPRVGDRQPTQLLTNPLRRQNPNLNVLSDNPLLPNGPEPASPRVSVSVPLGFPVGTYSELMRVIQDSIGNDQSLGLSSGQPTEPYSDPAFELIFKVRETRLTNTVTRQPNSGQPMTYPLVDDLLPAGVVPNYTFSNMHPAAARDPKGDLVMGFVSNRPQFVPSPGFDVAGSASWRLFFAGLDGGTPGTADNLVGSSPLRDLHRFAPATGRWFKHNAAFPNGYPFGDSVTGAGAANNLFGAAGTSNDYVLGTKSGEVDTVRFGSPSFPTSGFVDPVSGGTLASMDFAFLGEAQRQTPSSRVGVSRLFLGSLSLAADGSVSVSSPVSVPVDPSMAKGRPTVVQTASQALIYFAGAVTGQAQVYYTVYNRSAGTFTTPATLRLGTGFETLGTPSISVRTHDGNGAFGSVGEFTFSGKLRGRTASEIYYGRFVIGGNLNTAVSLGVFTQDRLSADREPGLYRARGLSWTRGTTPQLFIQTASGIENLEVAGTRQTDTNGVISFDSRLGGKAYLDPNLGTVRLARGSAASNTALLLTYQPRLLRVSANTNASYGSPVLLYDGRPAYRLTGDGQYWARNNNTGVTDADVPPVSRYLFLYGRSASGNGLTSRPYMATMRFGVQLPAPIHTQANGNVTAFTVVGASSFYQLDPANGRVYFTSADEARNVAIAYTASDAEGNPVTVLSSNYTVSLVEERVEAPLPIEQAVNEGSFTAFLDPISGTPRPGLIWMLFSSTRSGSPDLYIQTIAPRFSPVPAGK